MEIVSMRVDFTILLICLIGAAGTLSVILGTLVLIFKTEIRNIVTAYQLRDADISCTRCGDCCHHTVALSKKDVKRIEEGMDGTIDFVRSIFGFKFLKKKEDGSCVFLDSNHAGACNRICQIYFRRPAACRKYPTQSYLGLKGLDVRCRKIKSLIAARKSDDGS